MNVADVADRVRGVITPTKTPAEQAAADATELERHIERTKTERARRVATATDLQRQLTELTPRRDLLRARRDRGLATRLDDVDQMDQDLAVLEAREAELTAELVEAVEAVKRADLIIPDFERQRKAAAVTVITEQRRANLPEIDATCAAFEEWYRQGIPLWRQMHVALNREQILASDPALAADPANVHARDNYLVAPSLIPPLDYLGPDITQMPERVRQFRQQLGQIPLRA